MSATCQHPQCTSSDTPKPVWGDTRLCGLHLRGLRADIDDIARVLTLIDAGTDALVGSTGASDGSGRGVPSSRPPMRLTVLNVLTGQTAERITGWAADVVSTSRTLTVAEGARILGLNGAEIVFIPSATSRGLSQHLWRIEQTAHAIFNTYFVGTINRVGIEEYGEDDFYGESYFCDPRGQFIGDVGSAHDEELIVRDMDLDVIQEVRNTWHFYFNRRPELYTPIVEATVSEPMTPAK